MSDYFYGWYFRCQGKEGSIAVIPAVHISAKRESCSIQIITESGSWNKVFPIRQFRINRGKGIMQIGENLFSRKGIRLNLETAGNLPSLSMTSWDHSGIYREWSAGMQYTA